MNKKTIINELDYNVLLCITQISEQSKNCKMDKKAFEDMSKELDLLSTYLNITIDQAFFLANIFALNYQKDKVNIDSLSRYFKCNPLLIISYKKDFDLLIERKLIKTRHQKFELDIAMANSEYAVTIDTSMSIVDNKPLQAETNPKDITLFEMLEKVQERVSARSNNEINTKQLEKEVVGYLNQYKHLEFSQTIKRLKLNKDETVLLLYLCYQMVNGDEGVYAERILSLIFDSHSDRFSFRRKLYSKQLALFNNQLICFGEKRSRGGIELFLTDKALNELLSDDVVVSKEHDENRFKNILKSDAIIKKKMFYNEHDLSAIKFLTDSLGKRNFKALQKRLLSKNLSQGINILFYGTPGTGKTETAMQLAKLTGRDIMQVDISSSKSKWFSESEKLIKQIFDDYREACEGINNIPILLFNEADAILSKRTTSIDSTVDQTENAIQNILLEEMEKMKGIMIATTNLTQNLDSAFDRRFLHKIEFHQPNTETKAKIWKSKLKGYKKYEYEILAENFKLSGGQIDNVVRKATMQEVIYNTKINLEVLFAYCLEESDYRKDKKRKVGFSVIKGSKAELNELY